MTAIVGLESGGRVYIAGDSAATDDHLQASESDGKVWVQGPYVIGFCGLFRQAGLLRSGWVPPEPPATKLLPFIRTSVVRSLERYLFEYGVTLEGTELLVGVHGKLFHVEENLAVHRYSRKVAAIGEGGCSALASVLTQDQGNYSPEYIVRKAIQIACMVHPACGGRVTVRYV